MQKTDILLGVGFIMLAFFLFFLFQIMGQKGSRAEILYDGTCLAKINLVQESPQYYLLQITDREEADLQLLTEEEVSLQTAFQNQENHYNIICLESGSIYMLQSDCPDQICVHHMKISKTGESIICLPHKVVIQIRGADSETLDGVTY